MAYYYYTFNNKKYLKLLKLCMRPFQVAGTGMNLKDLMRFNFKDKWRTKEQDSISIAVHPGPELSSSCRPQAVRRGQMTTQQESNCLQLGREPTSRNEFAGTLILEFTASRNIRNKHFLFKSPSLWYFATAALN